MFSFFSKKNYLIDYLDGFVDIHNHILPGIDDGAKTVKESIELIKAFGAFGVKDFICTPHIMHNYYDNTPKTIKKSFKELKKTLKENRMVDVNIDHAAEHMIDDNFETILEKGKVLPIGKTHLLVEMSYLQPSINFDIAIEKIQRNQFFPIFAHPERYHYLHNDYERYVYYKANGLKFQLNLLSLSEYYGKEVNKMALKLLGNGLYDFAGSDAHNIRHLNKLKEVRLNSVQLNQLEPLLVNSQSFS